MIRKILGFCRHRCPGKNEGVYGSIQHNIFLFKGHHVVKGGPNGEACGLFRTNGQYRTREYAIIVHLLSVDVMVRIGRAKVLGCAKQLSSNQPLMHRQCQVDG